MEVVVGAGRPLDWAAEAEAELSLHSLQLGLQSAQQPLVPTPELQNRLAPVSVLNRQGIEPLDAEPDDNAMSNNAKSKFQ